LKEISEEDRQHVNIFKFSYGGGRLKGYTRKILYFAGMRVSPTTLQLGDKERNKKGRAIPIPLRLLGLVRNSMSSFEQKSDRISQIYNWEVVNPTK